jgi:MFS family permease
MSKIQTSGSRWLPLVVFNTLMIQGGIYVVRPIISYKSLELGADAALVGLIGATFALAPLIFAIRIGQSVDKGKSGYAMLWGSIILALTTIGLLFIDSIPLLMLAMPMLGIGHLLCMVGGQTMIANRSQSVQYERNFGLFTFYASLGHAFGPLIGGWLADSGEVRVDANAAFTFAIFMFGLAIASVLKLSTKKENQPVPEKTNSKVSVREVLAVPTFKSAIFVASATTAVVDVMLIFLPLFGRELGISVADIGLLLAMRSVASMGVRVILGQMTKWLGLKRILVWGAVVTLVSMVALALVKDFWSIAVIMLVSGFAMGIGQPATMAWVSRISNADSRGLAIAVRLTANRFGQVALPAVAGLVAGGGVAAVFYMLAAIQAASVLATSRALKQSD